MYSSTLAYLCFWFFIGNLVINIAAETQSAGLTRGQLSAMQSDTIGVIKKYLEEENKKASHLNKLIDAIESKTKSIKDVDLHESFDDLVERWKQAEEIMKRAQNVELYFRALPLSIGASLKLKGFPDERLSREVIEYIQYRLDWKLTDSKGEIPRIPIYTAECEDAEKKHYDGKRRPTLPHSLYFVADRDPEEPSNNDGFQALTKAVASAPCIFYIAQSSIAGAGRGVFSKVDLSPGMIIGPYDGLFVTMMSKDWEQPPLGSAGWTYAWKIADFNIRRKNSSRNMCTIVDARLEDSSNWLRFVNMPRFEEEQNVYALTMRDDVYYLVYKHIPAHTELLVWYGGMKYANWLGIHSIPPDLKVGMVAPPRARMHCPRCKNLPTVEEIEERKGGVWTVPPNRSD